MIEAMRDTHVVQNAKNTAQKAARLVTGSMSCSTFGDEVHIVLELIKSDPFIRHLFVQKECLPSVVLSFVHSYFAGRCPAYSGPQR